MPESHGRFTALPKPSHGGRMSSDQNKALPPVAEALPKRSVFDKPTLPPRRSIFERRLRNVRQMIAYFQVLFTAVSLSFDNFDSENRQ
jgi:hypothetical protein